MTRGISEQNVLAVKLTLCKGLKAWHIVVHVLHT